MFLVTMTLLSRSCRLYFQTSFFKLSFLFLIHIFHGMARTWSNFVYLATRSTGVYYIRHLHHYTFFHIFSTLNSTLVTFLNFLRFRFPRVFFFRFLFSLSTEWHFHPGEQQILMLVYPVNKCSCKQLLQLFDGNHV